METPNSKTPNTPLNAESKKKKGLLRRLYDWVLHWADTKYGVPALALNAFTESSFFPVPPDALLMALSLARVRKSLWYAAVCSVASLLGGILGYVIGIELWYLVADWFFNYIPGFTHEAFNYVQKQYTEHAFLTIFGAGFTPIPYKVFTITAGVFEINFFVFCIASAVGRSMRFFLVAGLIRIFGEKIKAFIDKYFNILSLAFLVLLVLGFVVIKYIVR